MKYDVQVDSQGKELQPCPGIQHASASSAKLAKIAEKEKEERRKLYPVPPEAAANFRPAVGRELVEQAIQAALARRSKQACDVSSASPSLNNLAEADRGNAPVALQLGSEKMAMRSYANARSSELEKEERAAAEHQHPGANAAVYEGSNERPALADGRKNLDSLPEANSGNLGRGKQEAQNMFASTSLRRGIVSEEGEDFVQKLDQHGGQADLVRASEAAGESGQTSEDSIPELRRDISLRVRALTLRMYFNMSSFDHHLCQFSTPNLQPDEI